ncbi:putative UPF0481 protein At3g02645 [Lactuca sativa]|uniref:putative UPF0481 protein At3g02645 n=1 Tax=Lactuca sativa TaxID=4236 RepID=UPI000CCAFCB9|nr:putative UPF0481 protein At3g02645 [Lactuca sativa]
MEDANVESGEVDNIGNTVKFLLDYKENGEVLGKQVPPSIYMVPSVIRDLSPTCFNPKVVSIGPLHRHNEHLQGFEIQKQTYLHNWLRRLGTVPNQTLRTCVEKVIQSIEIIKECYGRSVTYNDLELAKMMVIDGCFILEFIQNESEKSSGCNMMITPLIVYDLLLIENQIPFFVLKIIFDCTIVASGRMHINSSFTQHISVLLGYYKVFESNSVVPNVSLDSTTDHLLHFVHKYYQPVEPMPSVFVEANPKGHTAVELHRAGMKFKPNEDENWAMALKLELQLPSSFFSLLPIFTAIPPFSWLQWPTLKMPIVCIHDMSELVLRNLLIYEQFSDVNKYVTSYVYAMDMLTDTPEDVAILVKSKVLTNLSSSNENAANMINGLVKFVSIPDFFYDQQWKDMDAYYNSYWPNTLAGLKGKYFNNPWNVIALIGALVLFALTVVQTFFTIKAANATNVTM